MRSPLPRRLVSAGVAGCALLPLPAMADDWDLGPTRPAARVALSGGYDGDGGHLWGVDAIAPLPADWELSFARSRQFDDDDDIGVWEYRAGGVATDPLADWVARLDYVDEGEDGALEITGARLELRHYRGPWELALAYGEDTLELFLRERRLALRRFDTVSFELGREAVTIGLGRRVGGLRLYADYTELDYDEDLEALAARPPFRLILEPATFSRATALPARAATLALSGLADAFDWQLSLLASESAVDGAQTEELVFGLRHPLAGGPALGARLGVPLDDELPESAVVSVEWTL